MASSNFFEVISPTHFQDILSEDLNRVSVINFWAPWAEPCKQMNEVVKELSNKYKAALFVQVSNETLSKYIWKFTPATMLGWGRNPSRHRRIFRNWSSSFICHPPGTLMRYSEMCGSAQSLLYRVMHFLTGFRAQMLRLLPSPSRNLQPPHRIFHCPGLTMHQPKHPLLLRQIWWMAQRRNQQRSWTQGSNR